MTRDELFRAHPSSPLDADGRDSFRGVPYFDYDPALRVAGMIESLPSEGVRIGNSGVEPIAFERFATARFSVDGAEYALELYWLTAYGGGVFVPIRDETSGRETYGGGRYLLDTVKGGRSRDGRRAARPRLQPRLQPVVQLRPALSMSALPAREWPSGRDPGGRADASTLRCGPFSEAKRQPFEPAPKPREFGRAKCAPRRTTSARSACTPRRHTSQPSSGREDRSAKRQARGRF